MNRLIFELKLKIAENKEKKRKFEENVCLINSLSEKGKLILNNMEIQVKNVDEELKQIHTTYDMLIKDLVK